MRTTIFLGLLFLASTPAYASETQAGMDTRVSVSRDSEHRLTKKQTKMLDEVTKLSAAIRVFRPLYGRWPKDNAEIESRVSGIDFTLFKDNVEISFTEEMATIRFFDGRDNRELDIPAEEGAYPASAKAAALDPAFRIRLSLEK